MSESDGAIFLTERDVVELVDIGDAIDAMQSALELEARGGAQNMVKTHVTFAETSVHQAIGASIAGDGFVGTKTWAYTPGGGNPVVLMFDAANGRLRAVIEANAMGQLRTGAMSGVATHWQAAPHAKTFAIVGSGKQALTQAAAVAAVRTLESVRVFSPTQEHREALCGVLAERAGITAIAAQTLEEAVTGADIITLITRARAPFLRSEMVGDGTHVNAAGAIVPANVEFFPDLLARCSVVTADSVSSVRTLSREFMDFYDADDAAWSNVSPLSAVAGARRNRHDPHSVSLFKSVGIGLADVALGIRVYRAAVERGAGTKLEKTVMAAPNYRAKAVSIGSLR